VSELPTGTVSFLFTDVEGSTKLLRELGADRYTGALAEHRRVLRQVFERHGGVEVDTQGDAFFVAFSSAEAAIATAADAQRVLEIPVRIGIHTGEPHVSEEGYVGLDVHRAARICAVAHGGQVVVSETAASAMRKGSDPNTGVSRLRDLGLHRLKDLGEPVRLFQLGDEEFPPLRSLNATNLPVQPNALVGRERELEDATALLRDGARLVTLTGPGGTGKTRLALQAAAELTDALPDGVFWVPLAALRDPELVIPTIEQTLGAKVPLPEHVDEKRMLLLLDNLEQVVDCAPALADALANCPNLRLLVTSRVLLRLQGEREYQVPPLPEPDAVKLFRERAATAVPEAAVAEICRRLDGLPLAIELAAARTRVLPPEKLLERLEQRLPLLTGGARDAPERQRTLRATIEWSYDLLSAEEQELFRRLSVFAGGFTLEAAEQVADADLDTLESLVEKSLVRQEGERFTMLETIREFALENLEESGGADSTFERHAAFFCSLAEQADAELDKEDIATLEKERRNVSTAVDWASEHSPETFLRLVASLGFFWLVTGTLADGTRWASAVTRLAAGHASPTAARALTLIGELLSHSGSLAAAAPLKEEALRMYDVLGDLAGKAATLADLGTIAVRQADLPRARRLFEHSLKLRRQQGSNGGIAHALLHLGDLTAVEGDLGESARLLEEAVARVRREATAFQLPATLHSLGHVLVRSGEHERAEAALTESMRLSEELGQAWPPPIACPASPRSQPGGADRREPPS
jgi:predicted ATPase/class 3 adenylate cyclase